MKHGGWINSDKGWELDPSQVGRVAEVHRDAMDRIDEATKHYPSCTLCGQRCIRLDEFGLCSKIKGEHDDWRADARRERSGAFR